MGEETATAMDTEEATPPTTTAPPKPTIEDLKKNVSLLERAVQTNQLRLIGRVLRNNTVLRTGLAPNILAEAIKTLVSNDSTLKQPTIDALEQLPSEPVPSSSPSEMDVEPTEAPAGKAPPTPAPKAPLYLPEVEAYLVTLAVTSALRFKKLELATELVTALVGKLRKLNRRTLDLLAAKALSYFSFCFEQAGRLAEIRPFLTAAHRTACLHHDEIGQATVLNLLLRNLLHYDLIEQASNLVARTNFPEGASNNQLCRYLYYVGHIQAIQLDYTEAYTRLNQASRKAPQGTALGFRRAVNKLLIIVQLLMGDIPERNLFVQKGLKAALAPYLSLTAAVRQGDLLEFNRVVESYASNFKDDKTYTLILRLAHNVIKIGLRKISISYSRISLDDISAKLHLDGASSAEFVCAKAIKDGVIEAVLDHEQKFLQSREVTDVYATSEPQQAFHKRITFCLDTHNEAVRSMRFPANAYKKEEGGPVDEMTEEEIAKEIENELAEDGDF